MKFTIVFLFILTSIAGYSQLAPGSIKFFAEEGEKFTIYIDGEAKNMAPSASVKVEGISSANVHVRIVFEDQSIPPLIKTMMRWGIDETVVIKKNKKGIYDTKVLDAQGGGQPVATPAPMTTTAVASGPLTARYADGYITLSDGRSLKVTRTQTHGMNPNPAIEMKGPVGAKVHFTYDENREEYKGEVPFIYNIQDYNCNNIYFKMEVTETNGAVWSVKMQNGTSYKYTIE